MANSTITYQGNDGRTYVDVTLNKTLVAADSGIIQNVVASGVTVTAPATVIGYNYIVRNGGLPITGGPAGATGAGLTVNVAPTGTDGITGNGFVATASKNAVNTAGNVGDEIEIQGSGTNSVAAWIIEHSNGVWTRQP